MNGSKIPNVPTCAICSKPIRVGTGRFIDPGGGGAVTFVHSGRCATRAGAVEGGVVVWGEISELLGAAIEGRDPVVTSPKGFAVVGFLQTVIVVVSIALLVMTAARFVAVSDVVADRGAAQASIVSADHRVPGGSR